MRVTLAAQIECVEREISMRRKVYPRFVAMKKMSQAKADAELAAMQAVLETLRLEAVQRPRFDPLSQALNEGDGVYRP